MKTKFRKLLVITVALVMVFAMSATAFADNIHYTVAFTKAGANGQGIYNVWGAPQSMSIPENANYEYNGGNVNLPNSYKAYFTLEQFNNANINPLYRRASVMDAIIKGARSSYFSKTVVTGVDLTPMYGNPGAFIKKVGELQPWNQYSEYQENGQWYGRSIGEGWQCYITPAGGTEAGATSYLSSIAVNEGDYLRFDFRFYDYTWPIDGPSQ